MGTIKSFQDKNIFILLLGAKHVSYDDKIVHKKNILFLMKYDQKNSADRIIIVV